MLLRRIKNLWQLSAYKVELPQANNRFEGGQFQVLRKDFPTVKNKMAIIIPPEKEDIFESEKDD